MTNSWETNQRPHRPQNPHQGNTRQTAGANNIHKIWELTHPDMESATKTMVDQGNYTQALEQAIKTPNGTIARENKTPTLPPSPKSKP